MVCVDPDGYVVINWAGERDDQRGRHRPHELYKVESENGDSQSDESSEDESSSENEVWETASEEGRIQQSDDNNDRRPRIITSISAPSESDDQCNEPTSPAVHNVDVEDLNNANNMAACQVEKVDLTDAGIMLYTVGVNRKCIHAFCWCLR